MTTDWLPALILLAEHNGNWESYLNALYAHFRRDFIESKPMFRNCHIGLKRHPVEAGKECTFWHFISEGLVEAERQINLRRCERVCWPRQMIEQESVRQLPVWEHFRGKERRIAISLPDFSYLLILAERSTERGLMYLPWTAYPIEHQHRRNKLKREWELNRI